MGGGRLSPGGRVLSQTEVLGHQSCPEASFVLVTGGNVGENTRAWIVSVDRPAAPSGGTHDICQQLGLQTQPDRGEELVRKYLSSLTNT